MIGYRIAVRITEGVDADNRVSAGAFQVFVVQCDSSWILPSW